MSGFALDLAGVLLTVALSVVLIPIGVLLAQVLLARSAGEQAGGADPARPRLAVLMPAHNEALGIESSIRSVLAQLRSGDRLLVVADNCSDNTAAVARAAGAQVVERQNANQRGKGYALDFGVRHLALAPPEVVVIVDADCLLGPHALDRVSVACRQSARPVQALYLMHAAPGSGLKQRVAELAWLVKNQVRPLGFWRLGLPCQLMGTGMAFEWRLIENAPLATGHITEDLQLGLQLASAGSAPMFCPTARVFSSFPTDTAALAGQRTRWEHGHFGVIAQLGPRYMLQALARRDPQLLAMVLDLCVPPLASLALVVAVGWVAALGLLLAGGSAAPIGLASAVTVAFALSVLCAWWRFGRHTVSLLELFSAPVYVMAKLPIYARLFYGRQVDWVRTKRDGKQR